MYPVSITKINSPEYNRLPVRITCPFCHTIVVTRIRYYVGFKTWLSSAIIGIGL